MTSGINTIIYPVTNLAAAKQLFETLLGTTPYADEEYYVGFKVGGQDVGLDPNGEAKELTGPTPFLHVDDIESRFEAVLAAGAEQVQPISRVGGSRRIATAKDKDGNMIGLLQDS